jgi:F-type H+-transporting ATPase subunit delta
MSEIRVASRYAKSLFDLALERNKLGRIEDDAETLLQTARQSHAFDNMLKSPIITPDKKLSVIKKIFSGAFDDMTLAFINIVIRKGREMLLVKIFQQFVVLYKAHENILSATVTTAVPIDEHLRKDIVRMLHEKTNCTIDLHAQVNSDMLGGFVLRYEDKLVDASVATQLKALKDHLLNNN